MTSRNSFWKFSKWNFKKRAWALVLLFVIWFFALPVAVFSKAGTMIQGLQQSPQSLEKQLEWTVNLIVNRSITGSGLYGVFAVAMGIFLALQGFSWNNHQSRVDMYKSVPVKENTRFWYINFNSFLIFILSFGINMILANISAAVWGVWRGQFLVVSVFSFFMHLLLFASAYFVTLIAQMLTGNIALGFCGASVLLLIEPACFFLGRNLMSLFYETYVGRGLYETLSQGIFSPLSLYIGLYKSVSMKNMAFADIGNYGGIWKYIIIFLIQIVLYGSIAFILCRKRPAQTGGKTMIFPKTKPVIKCIIMILGSLAFGIFLAGFDERAKAWYGFFGVICGLLILQAVLQMIMEGDIKEVLKGKGVFGIAAAAALAVFAVFVFDLTGFDSYLPEEEKMESFAFVRANDYCYYFYDENKVSQSSRENLLENMSIEDEEAARILLAELKQAIESDDYYYKDDNEKDAEGEKAVPGDMETAAALYEDGDDREPVLIKFHLTNGKEVVRSYYLPLWRIRKCYCYLYDLEEYKEDVYSALQEYVANEFLNPDNHNYAYYRAYPFLASSVDNTKDPALVQKLFLAMQSDLRNRTSEDVMATAPVGELNFSTDYKNNTGSRNIYLDLPVYEADEETIALLEESGWLRLDGIDNERISVIRVYQYQTDDSDDRRKVLEIKQGDPLFEPVMEAFCLSERLNDVVDSGAFTKKGYYMEVETMDGWSSYSGVLFRDSFPEELEKAFENVEYDEDFLSGVG